MQTTDLEQQIAQAWASVELAQMYLDTAQDEQHRRWWANELTMRKAKWVAMIEELDRLHGGQGLAQVSPDYAALIAGIVLVMMACLGVFWEVIR
jgi:hypothetical protein